MRLPLSVLSSLYTLVLVDRVGLSYQGRISMDLYCLRRTSSQTCHRQKSSPTRIETTLNLSSPNSAPLLHVWICKILRGKSRKWWLPGCISLGSALNMTRDGLQRHPRLTDLTDWHVEPLCCEARLKRERQEADREATCSWSILWCCCSTFVWASSRNCPWPQPINHAKIAIDSWIHSWAQIVLEDLGPLFESQCLQKVPLDPKFAKIINRALTAMWSPGKGGNRRLPGTIMVKAV